MGCVHKSAYRAPLAGNGISAQLQTLVPLGSQRYVAGQPGSGGRCEPLPRVGGLSARAGLYGQLWSIRCETWRGGWRRAQRAAADRRRAVSAGGCRSGKNSPLRGLSILAPSTGQRSSPALLSEEDENFFGPRGGTPTAGGGFGGSGHGP